MFCWQNNIQLGVLSSDLTWAWKRQILLQVSFFILLDTIPTMAAPNERSNDWALSNGRLNLAEKTTLDFRRLEHDFILDYLKFQVQLNNVNGIYQVRNSNVVVTYHINTHFERDRMTIAMLIIMSLMQRVAHLHKKDTLVDKVMPKELWTAWNTLSRPSSQTTNWSLFKEQLEKLYESSRCCRVQGTQSYIECRTCTSLNILSYIEATCRY